MVIAETALCLAHNLEAVMNVVGTKPLIAAITACDRAQRPRHCYLWTGTKKVLYSIRPTDYR